MPVKRFYNSQPHSQIHILTPSIAVDLLFAQTFSESVLLVYCRKLHATAPLDSATNCREGGKETAPFNGQGQSNHIVCTACLLPQRHCYKKKITYKYLTDLDFLYFDFSVLEISPRSTCHSSTVLCALSSLCSCT